jgi:lysozyme
VSLAELYALIKRFEGCRLTPYLCPAGVWTCGWGSTGPDVMPGQKWTQEYADRRMQQDALRFARGTLSACPNLHWCDPRILCAIADFAYNCGLGALQASTLRRKVQAEDWEGAKRELMKWVRGGGRVLKGLQIRRAAESALLP